MTPALDRLRRRLRGGEDPLPVGLTLLTGAIVAAVVFPLLWLVYDATQVDTDRAWDLTASTESLDILLNSLQLTALVTLFSLFVGVPLAYLTVRTNLPFRRFWTVMSALPLVVPSFVGAFAFVSAFGPNGEFESALAPLGVDSVPQIYGLPGSVLVITLYTYPYVYLTTRAALLTFDESLVDAARTLNHGRLRTFWRVTLPHIRPAAAAGALLAALYTLSDFGTPAIMRLEVFTRQIYVENRIGASDYAALLSLQLLVLVAVILALEWKVRSDRSVGGSGSTSGGRRIDLGWARWPAMAVPAAIASTALLVPTWILWLWVRRSGETYQQNLAFDWLYAYNSVSVAFGAAVVAGLLALPVAYFAANHESPLALLFERLTYVGFAVPGVVLALAFVSFGAGYLPWLYQTIPLLIFAYVVRFLPQAVGSTRTSILQVDARLVEASRVLGETSLGSFRRVTFPLVRSGVVAGAALVFLTTMKELPVTLILRPIGFQTLSTQIWRAQDSALFQHAAVPALLLMVVSALSMVVILLTESGDRQL